MAGLGAIGGREARLRGPQLPDPPIAATLAPRYPGPPVTRADDTARASVGWLLFGRAGRIDRPTYWAAFVVGVSLIIGIGPWLAAFGKTRVVIAGQADLAVAVTGVAVWILVAASIKRFHDTDRSGWWALIGFAPFALGLVPGLMRYVPGGSVQTAWVLAIVIGCLCGWITPGVLKGTGRPNRYGQGPRLALTAWRGAVAGGALVLLAVVFVAGLRFYAQEPSQAQLASGAPVTRAQVAPTVTSDLPAHYLAAYRPYLLTLLSSGRVLATTPNLPRSMFFSQMARTSAATRSFTVAALQLDATGATEADIRVLVAANNDLLALIPQFEVETTSDMAARFRPEFLTAIAAAVRVQNDFGITQQQVQEGTAPAA